MNQSMQALLPFFFDWLRVHNYSESTITFRDRYVNVFLAMGQGSWHRAAR